MPVTNPHKRSTPWGLFLLSAAMLVLILYSGPHSKGASSTNSVNWLGDQAGIRFGRNGIVHGQGITPLSNDALTISLAVQPGDSDDGHFRFLLLLHGGEDEHQLVIGQWRSWLVIMNGDDYDASRRRARIAVDVLQPNRERYVVVTSGNEGTTVYIDGQKAKANGDLRLQIPGDGVATRIVLGNSIYGRHPWEGDIFGLAFFDRVLSETVIQSQFDQWQQKRRFIVAPSAKPSGLYLFDKGRGRQVSDHGGGRHDLNIPERLVILTKEFLTPPFGPGQYRLYQDMVINIMGFIPMGFLLSALLWHADHRSLWKRLLAVMIACGAISLAIELAQAWIPTRSSQLLDWILNTLGAGAGVLLHHLFIFIFGPGHPGTTGPHT